MRKIMILFVASIVIVLSGCFVFAAEVSHRNSGEKQI